MVKAEQLFESLGLDITTAIRLFLKQAINSAASLSILFLLNVSSLNQR